jgi:nitroreductase/dihydropteridine reductase
MKLIDSLLWRSATKIMNGQKVPKEKLSYILEAARLAPSSSGLQPYRIILIDDKATLGNIGVMAYNQNQILNCSHLLVFASWDNYSFERMGKVFEETMQERNQPIETMANYHQTLWERYEPLSKEWHQSHSAKQAYISLGFAIAAAAEQQVDATPMEGFDNAKLDELLGLEKLGLKSAVLLALGYRDDENDWWSKLKKVRTPKERFIIPLT